jgi:hypothetical protein
MLNYLVDSVTQKPKQRAFDSQGHNKHATTPLNKEPFLYNGKYAAFMM